MKAKVVKAFKGVPEGQVYPISFSEGDVIEGSLALSAVNSGKAKMIKEAPSNKMLDGARPKKNGQIGKEKRSSSQRQDRPKAKNS